MREARDIFIRAWVHFRRWLVDVWEFITCVPEEEPALHVGDRDEARRGFEPIIRTEDQQGNTREN